MKNITDVWKILWFLLIGVAIGCGGDETGSLNVAPAHSGV